MPVIPASVSTLATIYGCSGLFDLCSDNDLMSLSFESQNAFLDWIGWELTSECNIKKNFITYVRPEASGNTRTTGILTDPCGPSNGVEWGWADFALSDFGLLRRHGPTRNVTKTGLKYCEAQPRYRLDGSPITSDVEYDMRLATEAIIQDLKREVINGNKAVGGQFSGLESLVKTNYIDTKNRHVQEMDSIVIDWKSNKLDGTGGTGTATWNGVALPAATGIIDLLYALYRYIRDRIDMAPALSSQAMTEGDMIFLAPSHVIRDVLNAYTAWRVVPGAQYAENNLMSYEARAFRDRLNGGLYGAGKIEIDGYVIHMMPYGWELMKTGTLSDCYLLTGKVGSVRLISGQLNDMKTVPTNYPDAQYAYTDGGRMLTWFNKSQTCLYREVEMQPRMLMWAPWAQVRFMNVKATRIAPLISPDPWNTSFFPLTSFIPAVNP